MTEVRAHTRAARTRRTLAIALATAAAGTTIAWVAGPPGTRFAPGIAILALAAVLVAASASRVAAAVAGAAALLVLLRMLSSGAPAADLVGDDGLAVAVGRWLQAGGVVVALGAAARVVAGPRRAGTAPGAAEAGVHAATDRTATDHMPAGRTATDPAARARARTGRAGNRRARWAQVVALLMLSAICAELLQAYDDSTGRPFALLFAIAFFAPLYGGPALIVREVARRTGRGWPSMVLMATAFAIIQPGVIDQSLFSDSYRDIADWSDSLRATYIDTLGLSAFMAQAFVVGHVVFSFCAPIALVEAMRPATARTPWLGIGGLAAHAALYLAVAAAVLTDHLATETSHATVAQVVGTLVVAVAFVVAALVIGRHGTAAPASVSGEVAARQPGVRPRRSTPRVRTALLVGLLAGTLYHVAPETWLGVALAVAVLTASGAALLHVARAPGWSLAHSAAVATGALLSRALLAFTYYPVVGEVSATRKYAHNVVMLLLVVAVGAYAQRRARRPARPAKAMA